MALPYYSATFWDAPLDSANVFEAIVENLTSLFLILSPTAINVSPILSFLVTVVF